MTTVRVDPVRTLSGSIRVPPDKSLTHRALLLGAISDGLVEIGAPLDSEDTAATLGAVEACGVVVEGDLGAAVRVKGVGLRGLRPPPMIDCLNAGTLMRLLPGLLVGQRAENVILDGDDSLRRRPMERVARPLRAMGATVWTAPGGTPPMVVSGGAPLTGISHRLEVASAQVKSCLLMAGLFAGGETWVAEPAPSRDHTELMLEAAGVELLRRDGMVGVRGPVERLRLPDLTVPGDFSSAAPHAVAAALVPGAEVRLVGVNLNPRRTGLLEVMRRMGVQIRVESGDTLAGEPVGDLVVRGAARLEATEVGPEEVPSMIDELPLVALLGALARGTTVVRGAGELRAKESDRIATVAAALNGIGAHVDEREDGFTSAGAPRLVGGRVSSHGDHRLAMLGAIAGLVSDEGVAVEDFEAVAVSYPRFANDLAAIGAVRS
jgi:3-phosphoshikimate 1-carboxyvinyltransferase